MADCQGGRLVNLVVQSIIPLSMAQDNVASAFVMDVPRLSALPGLGKSTGPVALIAGGPSLRDTLDELSRFDGVLFSCGSNHDFLIENGIIPKYHAIIDADGGMERFITKPHADVTYLLASQCDPRYYSLLSGHLVYMWHVHMANEHGEPVIDFRGEPTIPGGDFSILRTWPIAAVMGHREFHFFGLDCSFPFDCHGQHAYSYDVVEEPVQITTRDGAGRTFWTTLGWMAQLRMFVRLLAASHDEFKVIIHGDSLVADVCCAMSESPAAAA